MGFQPVQAVLRWAEGIIQIYTNPSGIMELPDDDPSEYHSMYEALAANGISTEGLPTWVPRDYAILSVTAKSSDGVIKCVAVYESNRGNIVIRALKMCIRDRCIAGLYNVSIAIIDIPGGIAVAVLDLHDAVCGIIGEELRISTAVFHAGNPIQGVIGIGHGAGSIRHGGEVAIGIVGIAGHNALGIGLALDIACQIIGEDVYKRQLSKSAVYSSQDRATAAQSISSVIIKRRPLPNKDPPAFS